MADSSSSSLLETKWQSNSMKKKHSSLNLWLSALILALSAGFHFGYNLIITNPSQNAFIHFLNETSTMDGSEPMSKETLEFYWSIIVALLFLGMLFGAFQIRLLSDSMGRKRTMIMATIGQTIACTLSIGAFFVKSYYVYAFSRFLLGFFQSIAIGVAPMYISEASPPAIRGRISSSTGLFVQLSIVIGSILAMPQIFGTPSSWWILYAIELVVFIIVLVSLPFLHESPSYLSAKGNVDAALRSVSFYHGIDRDDSYTVVTELIDDANSHSGNVGIWDVWKEKRHFVPVLTGCAVMISMITSGIVVINGYAVAMLGKVGLSSENAAWANIGISVLSVVGCLLSSIFVDRYGRRPLLLSTLSILFLVNCVIVLLMYLFELTQEPIYGEILVAAISLFSLIFSAGPAPLSFFISAELCSINVRGASITWTFIVNAIFRSVILAAFPKLESIVGTSIAYFSLFIPISLCVLIYLFTNLPETKPIPVK